jgi:hypothetical protein
MSREQPDRLAGISGLLFIAFMVPFIILGAMAAEPGSGASRAEWRSYYLDSGNQDKAQIAAMVLGAAAFFFLPFLAGLRTRLRAVEGDSGWLSSAALAGGIAFITLLLATAAVSAAVVTGANYFDDYRVNVDVGQTLSGAAYSLITYAGISGGVLAGSASLLALRTRVFPRWLAIAGLAVAVIGFFSTLTYGVSIGLLALWVLAVSIRMTSSPGPAVSTARPALGSP